MLADHRDLQGFEGQAELLPFLLIGAFAVIGPEQGDRQHKREGKQCWDHGRHLIGSARSRHVIHQCVSSRGLALQELAVPVDLRAALVLPELHTRSAVASAATRRRDRNHQGLVPNRENNAGGSAWFRNTTDTGAVIGPEH